MMPSIGALEIQAGNREEFEEAEEFILLTANHPLLAAYEEYIHEIERSNQELFTELKALKRAHEQLEKESDAAYKNLLEKTEELANTIDKDADDEDFLYAGNKHNKELYDIIDQLKKEQEVLNDEIDAARAQSLKFQAELKEQTQAAEELEANLKAAQNKAQELESKLEIVLHERDVLDSKLTATQNELKATKAERDELYTQKLTFEGEAKILQRSFDQYKSNYEDLELRKASDIKQLERELSEKALMVKDARSKLMIQERELVDLKDINRTLQRDLEQIKKDNNQIIKIMEDNEIKVSLFDDKEKTIRQKEQELRRKVSEMKTREEEFMQKEKQYKKQISQLEEQWKEEVEEQHKKYESIIEASRARNRSLANKKDDEYNFLYEKCGRQENNISKLRTDVKALEDENRKLLYTLKEEQRVTEDKYKIYEDELRTFRRKQGEDKRKAQTQVEELQGTITGLEMKLKETEQEARLSKQQMEKFEAIIKEKEEQTRQIKEELAETKINKENTIKEFERLKKLHQTKCEELTEVYNMKVLALITFS